MAPTLEILRASATDLYRTEGPKSVQGVIDILAKTDGHIATYVGTEIQDPDYWWAVIVWETLGHHQALIDNKEVYPTLIQDLFKGAGKIDFMNHYIVSPHEPYPALDAPTTEIAVWKPNAGTDKEEFKGVFDELITKVLETGIPKGGGWGPALEDDNKFAAVLGWNSLDDFKGFIGGHPWAIDIVQKMKAIGTDDLRHVVLKKQS
ncbi:hypothetical protein BC835DRAFT_1517910 [Cytidiella melzeri]|nr:hypothetical protein BC835DRAFT_1517910 [Cytidiella melzeri]